MSKSHQLSTIGHKSMPRPLEPDLDNASGGKQVDYFLRLPALFGLVAFLIGKDPQEEAPCAL
jgi:hypothetical protein